MENTSSILAPELPEIHHLLNAVWVSTTQKFLFFSSKENCRRITFGSSADLKQYVNDHVEAGYLIG